MALNDVLPILSNIQFDQASRDQWAGKLGEIHEACARFIAGYLDAVFEATKKPTPRNPEGEIHFEPMVRLARGSEKLKTTEGKREIRRWKRIIEWARVDRAAIDSILEAHPHLKEAYQIVVGAPQTNPEKGKNETPEN